MTEERTVVVDTLNGPVDVGTKVYVGNLSWSTSSETLKDFTKSVGEVVHADVMMRGGKSSGGGIVEFSTPEEAAAAIRELNDVELDGRKIFIREDRKESGAGKSSGKGKGYERGEIRGSGRGGPKGGAKGGAKGGGKGGPKVFFGNLPWETSWQELKEMCREQSFGDVHVATPTDANGRPKGFAIITFNSQDDADRAVGEFNDQPMNGRPMVVYLDKFSS